MQMVRWMCGASLKEGIQSSELRNRLGIGSIANHLSQDVCNCLFCVVDAFTCSFAVQFAPFDHQIDLYIQTVYMYRLLYKLYIVQYKSLACFKMNATRDALLTVWILHCNKSLIVNKKCYDFIMMHHMIGHHLCISLSHYFVKEYGLSSLDA